MKKTIWINKAGSFEAADEFDREYYGKLSPSERLEAIQFIRESYFSSKGLYLDKNRKRLRRVFRIIKQT